MASQPGSEQQPLRQRTLAVPKQPKAALTASNDSHDNDNGQRHSSHQLGPSDRTSGRTGSSPRRLFGLLLAFRLLNALLTRTYFQPDEYWQSQEIAHRIVFGYGYTTWEWVPLAGSVASAEHGYIAAAFGNLWNGPIRGILHPLLFVPTYWLLKLTCLDGTRLLVLAPRLQQAVFAALGDLYTFKLARRIAGEGAAYCTLLVSLTNVYTFFTATRTFSNTLEATITVVALFYWPFAPLESWQPDAFLSESKSGPHVGGLCSQKDQQLPTDGSLDRRVAKGEHYSRMLSRSLWLAALACLLRPTNGIIWIFLFLDLLIKVLGQSRSQGQSGARSENASIARSIEVVGELVMLLTSTLTVAFAAIAGMTLLDTFYFGVMTASSRPADWPALWGYPLPLPTLTPLSFFHRNVVASLSLFYGANPWHWYLSQGIPVLCTTWLPVVLLGWRSALRPARTMADQPLVALARVSLWTVGVFSLLGHKEFRFLQPILPLLCLFAGVYMSKRPAPAGTETEPGIGRGIRAALQKTPRWLRTVLVTVQVPVAIYLTTFHCSGQESVTYLLGRAARHQQDAGTRQGAPNDSVAAVGRIRSIGFLMPCHSTPWQSSLHWQPTEQKVEATRLWFIECPPPGPQHNLSTYMDQSDFFYADPFAYLSQRFPENVDTSFRTSAEHLQTRTESDDVHDLGWRHSWPSHVVVFDNLLEVGGKEGSAGTVGALLAERGYVEKIRLFNTYKHEDARRDGDVVVLAHLSVCTE